MALDLISGFLLVILTGLGFRSGMLAQLTRFAALTLIFFGAPPLSRALIESLYGVEAADETPLRLAMTALAGAGIYVATMILSYVLLRSKDEPTRQDRISGAVLGFVKALVVVYLLIDGVIFLEPRIKEIDPEDRLKVQNSRLLEASRGVHEAIPWVEPPKLKRRVPEIPARRLDGITSPKLLQDVEIKREFKKPAEPVEP
jgi:hypothetical protein